MLDVEEIKKYANDLRGLLVSQQNFTHKVEDLLKTLNVIASNQSTEILTQMKSLADRVDSLEKQLVLKGMPGINKYEMDLRKLKELINSDEWPEAVPAVAIPVTEQDKMERAKKILNLVVTEYLQDKRILDLGCGEGHIARAATESGASLVVGYDIEKQWNEIEIENLLLTTDPEIAQKSAPYDIIIIYDVLDHVKFPEPIELLEKVKNLLSPDGRVYIRMHPWTSRHGGHLYNKVNKAYLHLFLDEVELLRLFGFSLEPVRPISNPVEVYAYWFEKAGFTIKEESVVNKALEDIFLIPPAPIKDRMHKNRMSTSDMVIEYVDYILEITPSNHQML